MLNKFTIASAIQRSRSPFGLISEIGARQRTDIRTGHAAVHITQQMALIHNTILRALNSSYSQCLAVKAETSDAEDFLLYNQCIFDMLHEHHANEEGFLFQEIEKLAGVPGLMDHNVEQHRAFQAGVERFRDYVYNTTKEDYDGQKLQDLIDGFGSVVTKHLHDEIPSLLDMKSLDSAELMKIWRKSEQAARSRVDQYRYAQLSVEGKAVY